MLIIVVIADQLSYDEVHYKSDRIYRVQQVESLDKVGLKMASNPYALGVELRENYAFAEKVVILNNTFGGEALYKDTRLSLGGFYTGTSFFDIFDFQLQKGSVHEILDEPYSIILSSKTADKFFGDEDPLGKFIEIESYGSFEVKGVIAESKKKSHIQFEALVSASTLEIQDRKLDEPRFVNYWETAWGSWIYLLLPPESDLENIQQILDKISIEKYKDNDETNLSFYLQAFDKIVPGSLLGNEKFVIASEMAVEHFQLGSPQEAIGTTMILGDSSMVEIIGIIKNHQYVALFLNTKPLFLRYLPRAHQHAFLRLQSPDMTATVAKLERTWEKIDPNHNLDGDFLDGRIRYYYSFFEDIMYTVGFATLLAIIIAGFGLLGMATYSTQTRPATTLKSK